MMYANVYDYMKKERNKDNIEYIASYHGIVLVPSSYVPVADDDPAVASLLFGTPARVNTDHYYDLLIMVDTTDETLKHWRIEHVSSKGNVIVSVGTSKDVLTQEITRLEKEGYTGYSTEATKNAFPEYKFQFV